MKAQLKAEVLERCRHFAEYEKLGDWEATRSWGDKWTFEHYSGDVTYCVDANADESSPVWAAVAEILGIKNPEARVSETLLWEAYLMGTTYWGGKSEQHVIDYCIRPVFDAWLASLPADPLEADRELVAKFGANMRYATSIHPLGEIQYGLFIPVDIVPCEHGTKKLGAGILRLAGLEVPHE